MEDGMKVGFIGLGTMGSGMAMNTLKGGFDLTVHDVNRDAAGPHLEAGATCVFFAARAAGGGGGCTG
jgi:3-hydroxyisobutyrate dehydrogenase